MAYSRIVALIGLVAALLVPAASRADQTWLVVSDIHLNPYDALQRPSWPGGDSNIALFESSLAAMKRAVPEPAVVLLPGDFLAHHFARLVNEHAAGSATAGAALETMRGIAKRFAAAWGKAIDFINKNPDQARKYLAGNTFTPDNVVDMVSMLGYVMAGDMSPKQIGDLQKLADFGNSIGVVPDKLDVTKVLQKF